MTFSSEHLPPFNLEAEQSVLGSLLIDRDAILRVANRLNPDDFYTAANGTIYDAVLALYRRREPADLITVTNELALRNRLDQVGGVAYLSSLLTIIPTSVHIDHYAAIVEKMAAHRNLISIGTNLVAMGYDRSKDIADAMQEARAKLNAVYREQGLSQGMTIGDAMGEIALEIEMRWTEDWVEDRMPTGFYDLDAALVGGFARTDLVVVGARPSMGKTAFALQIMLNYARHQYYINQFPEWSIFFSSEMTIKAICYRALADTTGIPAWRLKKGQNADGRPLSEEFKNRIRSQMAEFVPIPIWINDTSQPTTRSMKEAVERFKEKNPVRFMAFDYLQIAGDDMHKSSNEVERVAKISIALKDTAKSTDITVMALAQLNRSGEGNPAQIPGLSSLRQSGQIEQDADVAMFLHRQDYYEALGTIKGDQIDPYKRGTCDVSIQKQRDGEQGIVTLQFVPELTAFRNLDRRTA